MTERRKFKLVKDGDDWRLWQPLLDDCMDRSEVMTVREVLPGDVTLTNDESLSYQAQYIDVCDQLAALREVLGVLHSEMDSAWNRESVTREHAHRWGLMIREALTESEATDAGRPPTGGGVDWRGIR